MPVWIALQTALLENLGSYILTACLRMNLHQMDNLRGMSPVRHSKIFLPQRNSAEQQHYNNLQVTPI